MPQISPFHELPDPAQSAIIKLTQAGCDRDFLVVQLLALQQLPPLMRLAELDRLIARVNDLSRLLLRFQGWGAR